MIQETYHSNDMTKYSEYVQDTHAHNSNRLNNSVEINVKYLNNNIMKQK